MRERDLAAFWVLHHQIAPIGPEHAEAMAAAVANVAASSAGNKSLPYEKLVIFPRGDAEAEQSVEAMQHAARAATRTL